jgi:hypothetical protein
MIGTVKRLTFFSAAGRECQFDLAKLDSHPSLEFGHRSKRGLVVFSGSLRTKIGDTAIYRILQTRPD